MPNYSGGLKGAAGGAATGAAVGSVIPGWGTAVGAGAGALIGGAAGMFGGGNDKSYHELPGFQDRQNYLNQQMAGFQGPYVNQIQQGSMGGQFRQGQLQLMGQLQEQAAGRGPSLATQQFNQSLDRGANQQLSQAQGGFGNAALAGRNAAMNIGNMTQNFAGQAAQARMAEQLSARQQLAGLTGQGRAQELQGSQFNAAQFNNAAMQNARMGTAYQEALMNAELRNAQLQQAGMSGFGNQQTNMGDQILMGGGALAANYFANGGFGQNNNPRPLPPGAGDSNNYGGTPGYNPY